MSGQDRRSFCRRRFTKGTAGQYAVVLAVFHGKLSVDDDILYAHGELVGVFVSGLIRDGSGIEGDDIGEITDPQQAALRYADCLRREIAAGVNREWQGDDLFLIDINAQLAR